MSTDRESIFDYNYLREFEAKIPKALTVLSGISAEPIHPKKSKKSVSLPCPFKDQVHELHPILAT